MFERLCINVCSVLHYELNGVDSTSSRLSQVILIINAIGIERRIRKTTNDDLTNNTPPNEHLERPNKALTKKTPNKESIDVTLCPLLPLLHTIFAALRQRCQSILQ